MRLITAHRILILAAIVFFAVYGLLQLRRYVDLDEMMALGQSVISAVILVGLIFYYRTLKGWGERL